MPTATPTGWLIVASLLAAPAPAAYARQASDAPPVVTVEDVRTPETPAFVLLGVAPSLVERPSTPAALSVSLLSTFAQGDSALPTHYALEIAPYWLAAHRSLSRAAYDRPGPGQSMLQTLSFSVATSKPAKRVAPNATDIGVGVRVSLLAGHVSTRLDTIAARLATLQVEYQILDAMAGLLPAARPPPPALPDRLGAFLDRLNAHPDLIEIAGLTLAERRRLIATVKRELLNALKPPDENAAGSALTDLRATLEGRMQSAARSIQAEDLRRRGWLLTLAGAAASRVPDTGLTGGRLLRWGLWATPAYRLEQPNVDLMAVVRFTGDRDEASRLLDVGGRIAHQIGSFTWAGEYVERIASLSQTPHADTERLALTFEYRFARNLVLTAAFGKDFADPAAADRRGPLLSQLGITVGFGPKPTVKLTDREP